MLVREVDYFNQFQCIGSACKDCCCIGWELDIDEKSFHTYKQVEGCFGERLRRYMMEGDEETGACNTFRLKGNRCPFLNKQNLCDIYIELGKSALCNVCSEYPRFHLDYENIRERGLSLSCEVVGEMLFQRKEKVTFTEKEIPEIISTEDGEVFSVEEIETAREEAMELIRNRSKRIEERIASLLSYSKKVQEALNREEEIPLFGEMKEFSSEKGVCSITESEFYEEVFYFLEGLEVLDDEWKKTLLRLKEEFRPKILRSFQEQTEKNEQIEIWFEQLLIYFLFRYMTKAVYDGDMLGKVKFSVFGFLTIRMMLAVRLSTKKRIEVEDMVDICRIYSKEVEHSDENIAYLMEEFLFSDRLTEETMICGVRNAWND